MTKSQRRSALLTVLAVVLLAGCQCKKADFPVYPMETQTDGTDTLYVDGMVYHRNLSGDWDEQAHYYNDGAQYVWTPAAGLGEQIGVCGEDGGLAIYTIAGDEHRAFLYTAFQKFYFGGVESRLWMQEGITLGAPTAETVSAVTLILAEQVNVSIDDPEMIDALLAAFASDCVPAPKGESWRSGVLLMHHQDFPFLQYEIACCYWPEQSAAYCQNKNGEWFPLPSQWVTVILENAISAKGKMFAR